ncbi:MAG: 5-formyltetrahydrofolate cyclo-ligase [Hyphomonas sp.]
MEETGISWRLWSFEEPLERRPFGLSEPSGDTGGRTDADLTPLLAFDAKGNRLGYGRGHYDGALEKLRTKGRAFACAVAYAAQQIRFRPDRASRSAPRLGGHADRLHPPLHDAEHGGAEGRLMARFCDEAGEKTPPMGHDHPTRTAWHYRPDAGADAFILVPILCCALISAAVWLISGTPEAPTKSPFIASAPVAASYEAPAGA